MERAWSGDRQRQEHPRLPWPPRSLPPTWAKKLELKPESPFGLWKVSVGEVRGGFMGTCRGAASPAPCPVPPRRLRLGSVRWLWRCSGSIGYRSGCRFLSRSKRQQNCKGWGEKKNEMKRGRYEPGAKLLLFLPLSLLPLSPVKQTPPPKTANKPPLLRFPGALLEHGKSQ